MVLGLDVEKGPQWGGVTVHVLGKTLETQMEIEWGDALVHELVRVKGVLTVYA